ncbi:rhodanese domain-containing protein CG4456-like [Clavelina lepadiformis]|uniref:rhodanese domain-containing protein CG4456-like n=1 Tax=Clavelina lepadiformis TaxID=159417 RepID=UPI004042AEE7
MVDLPPHQKISCAGLKERLQKEDLYVIDVRNPPEIEQSGFISSRRRVNIPFPEFESALNLEENDFQAKYGIPKPTGDGSDLVIHCMIGGRGSKAIVLAEKSGLHKAQNLDGGYKKWAADGFSK